MNPFDYLFAETCRICDKLITAQFSQANTLCDDCWLPLHDQDPQLDTCTVPGFGSITVAHAAGYEKTLKTMLYKLKYDNDRIIAQDLAILLAKTYDELCEILPASPHELVPIPLSFWRKLKRGYNQAELLALHLKKISGPKINTSILKRRKHTKAQHHLSKAERYLNLENAFSCPKQISSFAPSSYILLDDIHTTGSTLAEAARTLFNSGASSVSAITVARAPLALNRHN